MDNQTIPCAAVRDLLPLYVEQMLSPETTALVDAHLAACPDCSAAHAAMTAAPLAADLAANVAEAKPLRRFRGNLLLNILGAPIWLPLLIAAAVTVFSLYAALWIVVIALFSLPIAFGASAIGCLGMAVWAFVQAQVSGGLVLVGAALSTAGLAIVSFIGCAGLGRLLVRFTAWICRGLARRKKEDRA